MKNVNKVSSLISSQKQVRITKIIASGVWRPSFTKYSRKKWIGQFCASQDAIKDAESEGQPCSASSVDNVQKVKQTVKMNYKVTTTEITECTSINWKTIRLMLHEELGMREICAKVVPRVLLFD